MCLPKISSKASKGADKVKPSTPRPYTTYNIFFQLEREYILQHGLNVFPELSPNEVFNISDSSYEGPDLPDKYQDLILRSDWCRPGKAKRNKKRLHRASHGKISFTDLSKRIAASWHNSDNQVKLFCAQLSDIGMMKYKREVHALKKVSSSSITGAKNKKSCSQTSSSVSVPQQPRRVSVEAPVPVVSTDFTPDIISSASSPQRSMRALPVYDVSSFIQDIFAHTPVEVEERQQTVVTPVYSNAIDNSCLGLVDMQDDEIFSIWVS